MIKEPTDITVHIRNTQLPKKPRIFDVIVNRKGQIKQCLIQNIRGFQYVDWEDV